MTAANHFLSLPLNLVQGASTFAGADGSRQPSELELDYAEHQVSRTICCSIGPLISR